MKRFLLITALLIACLSGCSNRYDDDAIQAYLDATEELKNVESLHLDVSGGIFTDEKKEMRSAKLDLRSDMILADQLQIAVNVDVSTVGVALGEIAFYVKDNTFYMNFLDNKTKLSFQSYLDQFAAMNSADGFNFGTKADVESVKSIFKEFKFEDKDAGIITFTFDLSIFDNLYGAMGNSAQTKYVIKSYTGTMKVQNNQITELNFDLTIDFEGKSYPIEFTISLSEQNQVKDIKFPSFKDYKEQSTQPDATAGLLGD